MVFGNTSLIWSSFLSIYHLRALAEQSEEFEDNSKFPSRSRPPLQSFS
ncbi:putative basic proline-rich protein-like isoform X2 [Iris pallida]|uniref:Basic proline-rich protein-like isoform X2 n=1 Tax=Iris pallida TaxID=29817 RepID=A0AAX6FBU6_IRIPA|nr:putative basic proline-rich protein-like isoform X2 [Iris pallida]